MDITIEQLRVLDTIARAGTIQKASKLLNKGHTAMIYSVKTLETQLDVRLFYREGRKNTMTPEGKEILKYGREILEAKERLEFFCKKLKQGWEPSLKIIYDGVVDFNMIGESLFQLNALNIPTEFKVLSAYLGEVEKVFAEEKADMMVTITASQNLHLNSVKLRPIDMYLVAHKKHGLFIKGQKSKLAIQDLYHHTYIKIKVGQEPVGLPTEKSDFSSYFFVNDFKTKKDAIQNQLGFGWLPDYLISKELKKGDLVKLNTHFDQSYRIYPRLFHKPENQLGRASKEFIKHLSAQSY